MTLPVTHVLVVYPVEPDNPLCMHNEYTVYSYGIVEKSKG